MNWLTLILTFVCMLQLPLHGLQVSSLSYMSDAQLGECQEVKLTLINERDVPEKVALQLCDYACNAEGEHFYEEPGRMARTNASWINLYQDFVTIPPKGQQDVYYTIKIPCDKNLNGSYWSVLLIEPSDPIQQLVEAQGGLCMNVKIRYAHHIVTTIGSPKPRLKIVKRTIQTIDHAPYLCIDVENTGDLFLNPTLTLKLYDHQGTLARTLDGHSERLYPGNSQRFLVRIESIQSGKYTGFLLLDNGNNNFFGDTFTIQFP